MRGLAALLVAAACLCSLAASTPIVFEDSAPSRGGPPQPGQGGGGASMQPAPAGLEQGEGRLFHKKKKKKKKVICGIASLIAGRDAAEGTGAGADPGREHRVARDVAPPQSGAPQGAHDPQGRGLPPGTGIAGFILGALVGSHFGPTYHAYPHTPQLGPTQTQVQVQAPVPVHAPAPIPVPVHPPINPAPVHEDYDDVEDDPGLGGGAFSICDQLQQRPDPGPLDSHFPLISGILAGGGGGGQRPYRPGYQTYGYGGYPQRPTAPGGNLLYNYFKPWTDLFFKK